MSNQEGKKCEHYCGETPKGESVYHGEITPVCLRCKPSPSQSCEHPLMIGEKNVYCDVCWPFKTAPAVEPYKHKDSCNLNDKSSMTRFCDCRDSVEPSVESIAEEIVSKYFGKGIKTDLEVSIAEALRNERNRK